jgi:hypothetical protein
LGYAWASLDTQLTYIAGAGYSYDSSGSVTVNRSATGTYQLTFPGISGTGGINQVTVYDAAARCSTQAGTETSPKCFNLSGTATDEEYEVLVLAPITGMPGSLQASAGTPQSAPAGTQFATALTVSLKDLNSNALSGPYVTFTAPTAGESGTFAGGLSSVTVQSSNGTAQAPAFTANDVQGAYQVTASLASYPGGATPVTFTLTNAAPVLESIAITGTNEPVPKGESEQLTVTGTYSDGSQQNITTSARWSAGSQCTITSAGVVTMVVSSGVCSITATSGGDRQLLFH